MKILVFSLFFLVNTALLFGQSHDSNGSITINVNAKETQVVANKKGELFVDISSGDIKTIKKRGYVLYSDFGAKGDGKTDDIDAIAASHAFANEQNLPVKTDDGARYYIGGKARVVEIQTDTDFGKASFIIDDTKVQNVRNPVFRVSSNLSSFSPEGITSLKKNQEKINLSLEEPALIQVTNSKVNRYIRYGRNQNNGRSQTDIFAVDKNGNVDPRTPIIWDFDEISDIKVIPVDKKTLKITGGIFTTIANQEKEKHHYYSRNLKIERSNVIIDGLEHRVTGELDFGAPYQGFISTQDCRDVTVQNTVLTGRRVYKKVGNIGKIVSMGSYDISLSRSINISFINCSQTNSIHDNKYWGIMGTNYCKNLLLDNCSFSRFDAHQGVTNAIIRNSTLGYMGVRATGHGTFIVENTAVHSRHFLYLRQDYGSTWQGDFIIRDCTFVPTQKNSSKISLIDGYNSGQHDFGYTCYMPEKITIENLQIQDSTVAENYTGPYIFSDFNPAMKDETYVEKYPYVITKKTVLKNITTFSGKELRVSDNAYMFRDVKVSRD